MIARAADVKSAYKRQSDSCQFVKAIMMENVKKRQGSSISEVYSMNNKVVLCSVFEKCCLVDLPFLVVFFFKLSRFDKANVGVSHFNAFGEFSNISIETIVLAEDDMAKTILMIRTTA
jgi:hypothetical protein